MKSALTFLLALAAAAHAQFAVMHTNGVVTSPANLTIQQSNVAGLSNALAGKLATNPTLAISNTTGLQAALDGKLATNGTLQVSNVSGLQLALDGKLGFNATNGQVQWTDTNALTFTNRFRQTSDNATNPPEIRLVTKSNNVASWFVYDAAGSGGQTNAPDWSVMWIGNNTQADGNGTDRSRVNQSIGASAFTIENMWMSPVVNSPVSEFYFTTTDTNNASYRGMTVAASQTNSSLGYVGFAYPVTIFHNNTNNESWYTGNNLALNVFSTNSGKLFSLHHQTTNSDAWVLSRSQVQNSATDTYVYRNRVFMVNYDADKTVFHATTQGVMIGGPSQNVNILWPQASVHLAGNTRIDGAITFNNTTNAATTRTNLGLGGGVTTNISVVGTNNTNTLVFSNGILTQVQ